MAALFSFLNVLCLFAAHSSADRLPLLLLVCTILLVMVSTELVLLIHLQFFVLLPTLATSTLLGLMHSVTLRIQLISLYYLLPMEPVLLFYMICLQ